MYQLVTREMGLAKIYPYTKFEVSSFTRFRFMEGGLKFNCWSLDPRAGDHNKLKLNFIYRNLIKLLVSNYFRKIVN